ncbi:hypothetical protein M1583_01620, partial [Candidatus Marsarchaeota archaeon]|nr:hypothetical protein [Candidatus Marsarchaeota archaeon]
MKRYMLIGALGFLLMTFMFGVTSASPTNASCVNPNTITSFNIVGVKWGLPQSQNANIGSNQSNEVSSIAAGPGQKGVPITITVDNNNNCELVDVQAKMPLDSYFTTTNSSSTAVDSIQSVQPFSNFPA